MRWKKKVLGFYLEGENMGKQDGSQRNSIKLGIIGNAVAEQLKSQAAEEGLEKGKRGTIATPQQIVGSRRTTENIFIGMLDDMPPQVKKENCLIQNSTARVSRRKRKRGPRTLSLLDLKLTKREKANCSDE